MLCRVNLPDKENAYLKNKNCRKTAKVPFAIYSDFKSFIENTDDTTNQPYNQSCARKYQQHRPGLHGIA